MAGGIGKSFDISFAFTISQKMLSPKEMEKVLSGALNTWIKF